MSVLLFLFQQKTRNEHEYEFYGCHLF